MRFLVDESLPRTVVRSLIAAGHDAVDVRDIGLRGKSDDEIASRASAEKRLIATADLDFSNALRFPPKSHPGILILRLPDSFTPELIGKRVVEAIAGSSDELPGAITIVEPSRIRIFG